MANHMGLYKVAAASPRVTVTAPAKNAESALLMLKEAAEKGVQLIIFPELHLSSATAADLFYSDALICGSEKALAETLAASAALSTAFVIGLPVRAGDALYNCAAVCQSGRILGVIPKTHLSDMENRWFASGEDQLDVITLCGQTVPFGGRLFRFGELTLGVVIGEDESAPIPVSSLLALSGANVIAHLAAVPELVGKHAYRTGHTLQQSGTLNCGYLYAAAGVGESSTDMTYGGGTMIAENGNLLKEGERFEQAGSMITGTLDLQLLASERRKNTFFRKNISLLGISALPVVDGAAISLADKDIDRVWEKTPFIPSDEKLMADRCKEIFSIQASALAKRLSHTGMKKAVIGISGGLDSTLAVLVAAEAMRILQYPMENILAVTMPGFGTTDRTYYNALELIRSIGAELMEIDIRPACLQHFADIGHDPAIHDVTYENAQARQRTYLLMDLANKRGGLLVGTGDLSEMAMGWCTYNGDHMSMYGVNAAIPKTLVRHLVSYVAGVEDERTGAVLRDILDTPVSPELLPPDENGKIKQKTEDTIGPYELHDFFIYHFVRYGFSAEKLLFMAERAFAGKYDHDTVAKWLSTFLHRFFISQFKRSCVPDGPAVGSVGFSPRGSWQMPSDASNGEWKL